MEWTIILPQVVQFFTVGQETGRLEEMIDRMAESFARQVASIRLAPAV